MNTSAKVPAAAEESQLTGGAEAARDGVYRDEQLDECRIARCVIAALFGAPAAQQLDLAVVQHLETGLPQLQHSRESRPSGQQIGAKDFLDHPAGPVELRFDDAIDALADRAVIDQLRVFAH